MTFENTSFGSNWHLQNERIKTNTRYVANSLAAMVPTELLSMHIDTQKLKVGLSVYFCSNNFVALDRRKRINFQKFWSRCILT